MSRSSLKILHAFMLYLERKERLFHDMNHSNLFQHHSNYAMFCPHKVQREIAEQNVSGAVYL